MHTNHSLYSIAVVLWNACRTFVMWVAAAILLAALGQVLPEAGTSPPNSYLPEGDVFLAAPIRTLSVSPDDRVLHVFQGDAEWVRRESATGEFLDKRQLSAERLGNVQIHGASECWIATRGGREVQLAIGSTTLQSGLLPHQTPLEVILSISLCQHRPLAAILSERDQLWFIDGQHPSLSQQPRALPAGFEAVCLSPRGHRLALLSHNRPCEIWDLETFEVISRFLPPSGPHLFASWSSDELRLLTYGSAADPIIWDVVSGTELDRFPLESRGSVTVAALSSVGNLAAIAQDEEIRLWQPFGDELDRPLAGHIGKVSALLFADDDQTLYSGDFSGTLRRWDVNEGRLDWAIPQ